MGLKESCWQFCFEINLEEKATQTASLVVLPRGSLLGGPTLLLSGLDCCQETLSHLLQKRHLQTLDKLPAANTSVHGALARVEVRRIVDELGSLWTQCTKRRDAHRDEIQLFLPDQMSVFGDFLPLFGRCRIFGLARVEPQAWRQGVGDGDIHSHRLRSRPPMHEDIGRALSSFDLDFICCPNASCGDEHCEAFHDDLVPAVELCLVAAEKMISESVHRVVTKRALLWHIRVGRRTGDGQSQPPAQQNAIERWGNFRSQC